MQAATVALLSVYVFRKNPLSEFIGNLAGKYGILIGFVFSLFALVMSLVYSEYFGIDPCGLCWLQRVFMYPQTVLFGVALFIKDTKVALYSIWLSVLGAVIALYQHYLQMGGTDVVPCPATGAGDCAKRFLFEFGYVTFPLVAFSLFAFLIILMLFVMRRSNASQWK
jgi:disulfide bond formation protein DsbB